MKLRNIYTATPLVKQRDDLLGAISDAQGPALGVTLAGRYQDGGIVSAARDAVITELRRRVTAIDGQLAQLGVEVDVVGGAP